MASNYPTSLDTFTNPSANDSLNSPSHALQHANANDAIEAIEAKLGIGDSTAGSATSGYVLTAGTGGTTTWAAPTGGLTLVSTQTLSASSGVSITGLSVGKRYRLFANVYGSVGGAELHLRFRENSTDKATSYYGAGTYGIYNSGTPGAYTLNNDTKVWLLTLASTASNLNSVGLDIQLPAATTGAFSGQVYDGQQSRSYQISGSNISMTSVNGISVYPASGTFTGSLKLYEYA